MSWKMDFDKTSFSVDWFTPGDKYHAPKRLSFPKSARMSIDDFVSDSPLSICFSPVGEAVPARSRTYSFVDAYLELQREKEQVSGWMHSVPPSPLSPPPNPCPESYPMVDDDDVGRHDTHRVSEENDRWTCARPGLVAIASECTSCGVDMDLSCFDALDEQLLVSPMECFTELCWAEAVQDEVALMPPVTQRKNDMRSLARSFKCEGEGAFSPRLPPLPSLAKDHPSSFECARPLAAKIMLPLETFPHARWSPFSESHDTLSTFQEKKQSLAHTLYTDRDGRSPTSLDHHDTPNPSYDSLDVPRPWRLEEKQSGPTTKTKPVTMTPPPTPRLRACKSSQALRVISDACATLTRTRKKSPL